MTVPGIPRPQGSKKAFTRGGRTVLVEVSGAVTQWRATIAAHAARAAQLQQWTPQPGAVSVSLTFILPRPQRVTGVASAAKRPDVDKLARAALDALTGPVLIDDSHVVSLHATKRVAPPGGMPGVHIMVAPFVEGAAGDSF